MFTYSGSKENIKLAVERANRFTQDNYSLTRIGHRQSFDMCTATPFYIANLIKTSKETIKVVGYYPKWRFSKSLGYFDQSEPKTIHFNLYKNLDVGSYTGLIIHEFIHYLDSVSKHSFGHGNNSPKGKKNTAPYWIGSVARTFNTTNLSDVDVGAIVYKRSFLSRTFNFIKNLFR